MKISFRPYSLFRVLTSGIWFGIPSWLQLFVGLLGPVTQRGILWTSPPSVSFPMAATMHQRQGRWAEQRALRLLQSRGWRLVSRNWHCRWGELDLVLSKPGRLLLVEVKGRGRWPRDGNGVGALHRAKRRRLERAWGCWQAAHPHLAEQPMELVAALVPLPPRREPVRWVHLL